ncbi:MAG: hypothetical protein HYZ75_16370 [Elusimicrobia bacterium]|nr:hypothetical protein [Elusimicrobiota bacterium]
MNKKVAAASLALVLSVADAAAFLSSALREHKDIHKELRDANAQLKSSLAATKALHTFNTTIYTLRTAMVAKMVASAAAGNCSARFPALYEQDDASAAKAAEPRIVSQEEPLADVGEKLDKGDKEIVEKGEPLAAKLRKEDQTVREKIGGEGLPSGTRADSLIADLHKAAKSGLEANKKGLLAQKAGFAAAKAIQEASKKETEAADKNDEISNKLNELCSRIKSLPEGPGKIPQAIGIASQGPGLHSQGSQPLAAAMTEIQKAFTALKEAERENKVFDDAIPGNARSDAEDLPYVNDVNDVRNRLDKKLAGIIKDGRTPPPAPLVQPAPLPEPE